MCQYFFYQNRGKTFLTYIKYYIYSTDYYKIIRKNNIFL